MRREEKRRKFREAVLNTLYPPPPSPPQEVDEERKPDHALEDFNVELINLDDFVTTSGGGDDEDDNGQSRECEPQKLTRAQRKRLRKKKIKEEATRRSKIIGPLLPPASDDAGDDNRGGGENERPGARQNAAQECNVTSDKPGELLACSNQNKLKQRRMAKRLAREPLKISGAENYGQDRRTQSSNEPFVNRENCAEDQNHSSPLSCDQAHQPCKQD